MITDPKILELRNQVMERMDPELVSVTMALPRPRVVRAAG